MTDAERMRDCLTHVARATVARTGRACVVYRGPVFWTIRDAAEDVPQGFQCIDVIEPERGSEPMGLMKKLRTARDLGHAVPKVVESFRADPPERRTEPAPGETPRPGAEEPAERPEPAAGIPVLRRIVVSTNRECPKVEILVGMIASGKSTYALRRADEGALVISHDALTGMLHARYRYEPGLRECYRRMEEAIARCGLDAGRDVVIDRTHLTRESRRRWIGWAADYDSLRTYEGKGPATSVVAVVFPISTSEIHAGRRFGHDARGRAYADWLRVAEHHRAHADAEPIDIAEGFHEIRCGGAAMQSEDGIDRSLALIENDTA